MTCSKLKLTLTFSKTFAIHCKTRTHVSRRWQTWRLQDRRVPAAGQCGALVAPPRGPGAGRVHAHSARCALVLPHRRAPPGTHTRTGPSANQVRPQPMTLVMMVVVMVGMMMMMIIIISSIIIISAYHYYYYYQYKLLTLLHTSTSFDAICSMREKRLIAHARVTFN